VTTYTDLGEFVTARLKANADVAARVVGGAERILESSELTGKILSDAEVARMESESALTRVLAVQVVDTGEKGRTASCAVYIYDREQGYTATRAIREAIIDAVHGVPVMFNRGGYVQRVSYAGRSGHVQASNYDVLFEMLTFAGELTFTCSSEEYY